MAKEPARRPRKGQLRLFDPGPALPEHPGDADYETWLTRPDVAYHATSVHPDHEPHLQPMTHYGTRGVAAQLVMNQSQKDYWSRPSIYEIQDHDDYGGDSVYNPRGDNLWVSGLDEDYDLNPGESRAYARRLHNVSPRQFSDSHVNGAQIVSSWERGWDTVPGSVASSGRSTINPALEALEQGQALPYANEYEKDNQGRTGHISYLVPDPDKTTTSWEQDVATAPRRPPGVREFMADRIARGVEQQTVPFSKPHVVGHQFDLFEQGEPGGPGNLVNRRTVGSLRPKYLDEYYPD